MDLDRKKEQDPLMGSEDLVVDDGALYPSKANKTRKARRIVLHALTAIFSVTFTLLTLAILCHFRIANFTIRTTNSPTTTKTGIDLHCGTTPSEARALGCHYDMMASRWEHPLCHDAELLESTLATGPWQWYRDANHTILVPREEVAEGNFPHEFLYVEPDYHIGHCMYMWMKQHREFASGGAISEDQWAWKHTKHCAMLVQGQWPPFSRTMAGFSKCRSRDVWMSEEPWTEAEDEMEPVEG